MTKRSRDRFQRESEASLPYTNSGRCQFCSLLLDIAVVCSDTIHVCSLRGQREALVVPGRDVVAFLPVGADSADVGHEDARLAGDVGPGVPGFGQGIERGVRHLVDVGHPCVLRLGRRLDRLKVVGLQVREAIGDPIDVLLDGDHHVADDGRAAGSGDGEEVRKAGDGDPEVGARSVGPLLPQRAAAPAADIDGEQRSGHGIEAGGEDDAVACVLAGLCSHPPRRDRLDRLAAEIDQGHVVAVERVVVVGVDADALGAERIVLGNERLGYRWIADYGADLGPEDTRRRCRWPPCA